MANTSTQEDRPRREQISTRVAADAMAAIEKAAAKRRTTAAHIARILIEDGARQLERVAA